MLQQSTRLEEELSHQMQHHQTVELQNNRTDQEGIMKQLHIQKEISSGDTENLFSRDQAINLHEKVHSDRVVQTEKNEKLKQQPSNYKDLLAERPTNLQPSSSIQNINYVPTDNQILKKSSTTTNFYVTKKNNPKARSSQKIVLSKNFQPFQTQQQQEPYQNKQTDTISDITVLMLLHKIIERMRARGDDMTLECLQNEEKLIHISIAFLEKKHVRREEVQKYFSIEKEIVSFVQKINKVTMENFKEGDENVDIKIFSKAVDLLMTPSLNRFVKDLKTLGKIKVLTFNNLACIYKKKRKFGIALRSVSFALQIEQALLNQQSNQQKYDIIPTYLNKAAILSQMNKHQKAIQQIMKSQKFIQKIQRQVIKQITQAQRNSNSQLKKRLEEKRYYGLYMKMIINYNMGAEKEHMKMIQAACQYYKQGRQLALMINNQFMVKKFQNILNKLMEARRK